MHRAALICGLLLNATVFQAAVAANTCDPAQNWSYQKIGRLAHDQHAFTQGLVFANGVLAESTGLYRRSSLRLHHNDGPETTPLPPDLFGEGLAWYDQRLWQLSWKAGVLRIYSTQPLRYESSLNYHGEGWGLTHDGDQFIMSDGSAKLQFRNSDDFALKHSKPVRDGQAPLARLNELEWVEPWVLANVWQQDRIAVIEPDTGCVHAWLDLNELWPQRFRPSRADVLNGIAWQADKGELWVTGKFWPWLFRLRVEQLRNTRNIGSLQ